jgi:uncharacterized protein (DUF427 family)
VRATVLAQIRIEKELTMKAVWNGATVAESDDIIVIEGNHYFPMASVEKIPPR